MGGTNPALKGQLTGVAGGRWPMIMLNDDDDDDRDDDEDRPHTLLAGRVLVSGFRDLVPSVCCVGMLVQSSRRAACCRRKWPWRRPGPALR
jgi:hypothetical protein